MELNKTYLTDKGQSLMAKLMLDVTTSFTKLVVSGKEYEDDTDSSVFESMTSLEDVKQQVSISSVEIRDNAYVDISAAVSNKGLENGYKVGCLGFYALDPDDGEILYAVAPVKKGTGDWFPADNGQNASALEICLSIKVGNSANISMEVDSGTYATIALVRATKRDLEKVITDYKDTNDKKVQEISQDLSDYKKVNDENTQQIREDLSSYMETNDEALRESIEALNKYKTDNDKVVSEAKGDLENHKRNTSNPHSVTKEQVGLGNVDNTSDVDKPVSSAVQQALDTKAPSTHTHTKSQIKDMPTKVSQFTNDSEYQTEAQVKALVSALVDSAPETMDTLKELADALGNDPNFATTVANQIGTKASTEYVNTELAKKAPVSHSHPVASKTASGFMPQLPNETATTKYLRQDGTWQVPPDTKYTLPKATVAALGGIMLGYTQNAKNYPVVLDSSGKAYVAVPWTDTNTTYGNMVGASASAAGKAGLVPAPAANNQSKYLRGDGTWQTPPNTTYSNFKGASASAAGGAGLVPAPAAGGQEKVLHGDGTWKDKSDFYVDSTLQKKVTAKTSRNSSASKVKVQLQDVSGRALYVETSADNIYITSGRFSGQLLSSVLEKVVTADSYADGVLTIDVPDSIARQTLDPEEGKEDDFIVGDDVDPGFIYNVLKGESK